MIIIGGPEAEDDLLAIVLEESEEAVPLFDSVEEAEAFLDSIGLIRNPAAPSKQIARFSLQENAVSPHRPR